MRINYSRFLSGRIEEFDQFVSQTVPAHPVPGVHRTKTLDLDIVLER
jgi:hypothetical protein